jgi:hypothetical protein
MQPTCRLRLSGFIALLVACFVTQTATAADTGVITGVIDKPEQVKAVVAVDRSNDRKFPGSIDAKTGRFTIDKLPLGATYDCIVDFGAARLEGVNLKVPRSDYEEEQPLKKEDIDHLKETAKELNVFEDQVEVMTVTGNIQHAAVLLNKLRTKPFYESKPGEVIWRLELWHFERPEETWVKVQDDLFLVLYRERLQKADFEKKSLTLDPLLGGVKPTAKQTTADLGTVKLPPADKGIRLRMPPAEKKPER